MKVADFILGVVAAVGVFEVVTYAVPMVVGGVTGSFGFEAMFLAPYVGAVGAAFVGGKLW